MSPCMPMLWWVRPMRRMMSAACAPASARFAEAAAENREQFSAPMDILDTALAAGSFKKLISAAVAAGIGETLKSAGPFTIFAPTDAAFSELPTGVLEDLLKPENKSRLQAILTYHAVAGRYLASDLANVRTLKTLNGKDLPLRIDLNASRSELRATIRAGAAKIAKADISCTNGVIHVLDRVLIPTD